MNLSFLCAQTIDAPREKAISESSFATVCNVMLPPVGNKAPTPIQLNVYGKAAERFTRTTAGSQIYIHGSKLRYDLETKTYSLHGGIIAEVDSAFPILNTVILSGRCVKDIDQEDARAFKTTADGLMICNQSLSVNTGRNQADLFNFYAINTAQDKLNNAELLVNFTRKGTGLTIQGRLVTDVWKDTETKERKSNTKIQLVSMTLAPKGTSESKPIQPQTTVASDNGVASLWGGKTAEDLAEPWGAQTGTSLPNLPGWGSASITDDDGEPPF
jgi:single-stranded DNA-binding protein